MPCRQGTARRKMLDCSHMRCCTTLQSVPVKKVSNGSRLLLVAEQRVELLPDVITCNTSIACEKREQWQRPSRLVCSLGQLYSGVCYFKQCFPGASLRDFKVVFGSARGRARMPRAGGGAAAAFHCV